MSDNQNQTSPPLQPPPPSPPAPPASGGEDKTVAIIAYITLIGFIVAIIIHMNKKTKLARFISARCSVFS